MTVKYDFSPPFRGRKERVRRAEKEKRQKSLDRRWAVEPKKKLTIRRELNGKRR